METKKCKKTKIIVFIGKVLIYIAGELSLKPTFLNSVNLMKIICRRNCSYWCNTSSSIPKITLLYCWFKSATNEPSNSTYAPGDVITMHNGKTIEIMNMK